MVRKTVEERFSAKVHEGDGGCHLWNAYIHPHGYGRFNDGTRMVFAHRWAYEHANGPIPDGLYVDHICHTRSCVNVEHLRLVTRKQNQENLSGVASDNTSGYRGVYQLKGSSSWRARVKHNGKYIDLGSFARIEDANAAAVAMRNKLFTHNDLDRVAEPA